MRIWPGHPGTGDSQSYRLIELKGEVHQLSRCMLHHYLVVCSLPLNHAAYGYYCVDVVATEHLLDDDWHIVDARNINDRCHLCSQELRMLSAEQLHLISDIPIELRDNETKSCHSL